MAMASPAARRGGRRSSRAPMAEINVTPLVDVMLVLLIIFMVTAPLLKAGVPIDLPDSRAKALAEKADQITISLPRDGTMWLDDAQVIPGELAQRLAAFQPEAGGKLPLVTLRADRGLEYGRVMAVMGELNHDGFTAITLVTSAGGADPSVTAGSGAGH